MTEVIIGLLVTMVFSAFFSGMEIAFVSSNRLRAEMDREKNGLSQRAIAIFYRHPNNFVSTMLVGNNIALVIYGILFAQVFDATLFNNLSDGARVTCDTLLSTLIVLFTGEFLPKTIFKSNPNGLLLCRTRLRLLRRALPHLPVRDVAIERTAPTHRRTHGKDPR